MSISADRHAEIFGRRTRARTGSYVFRDGKVVPAHEAAPLPQGPQIIRDHAPVKSPLERGKWIDGRADRRETMKRHNVREVEPSEYKATFHNERFAKKQGVPFTPEQRWSPQVVADHGARLSPQQIAETFRNFKG